MWYRFFKTLLARPLVKYGYGAKVIGAENFPRTGGAILASNHIAALDSLVVPAMMPRPLTFPAKAELFAGQVRWAGTRSRQLMNTCQAISTAVAATTPSGRSV